MGFPLAVIRIASKYILLRHFTDLVNLLLTCNQSTSLFLNKNIRCISIDQKCQLSILSCFGVLHKSLFS
jgi:hypothetical protein